jgi:hypothetical protein
MTKSLQRFRARFSPRTDNTTIHADGCSAAQGKPQGADGRHWVGKSGDSIWRVDAVTAEGAAASVYESEDMRQRGLPRPRVCHCAKNL